MYQITDLIGNLIKAGSFVSKGMTVGDQGCTNMAFCFYVTLHFRFTQIVSVPSVIMPLVLAGKNII